MRIFIFLITMTLSVAANALVEKKTIKGKDLGQVYVVPRPFTYGDNTYFAIKQDVEYSYPDFGSYDGKGTIVNIDLVYDIYNDDIEKIKSIASGYYQERLEIEQYQRYSILQASTWKEAKEKMKDNPYYSIITEIDDSQHRFNTEHGDDGYLFWDSTKGKVYVLIANYWWKPYESHEKNDRPVIIRYVDYDDVTSSNQEFIFSQTLFNDDEDFEFIVPTYNTVTGNINDDKNGDGFIDEDDFTYYKVTGFDIVSEGGNVLHNIKVDIDAINYDNHLTIMKLNGKIYLVVKCNSEIVFYRIEKSSVNGVRINQVHTLPANNTLYNLKGQKVNNALANGIYIQNGKKIIK